MKSTHQPNHSVQISGKGTYCFNCRDWVEKAPVNDALLKHLERGGQIHFAKSPNAKRRCGVSGPRAVAASNYWPAVTCRDCQELRTKVEGNVRTNS